MNNKTIKILADSREQKSNIPEILRELGADVTIETLKTGDYILNDEVIVERKSRDDFITTLIQRRLFNQLTNLKKTKYHHILLIEGNPYNTSHNIEREAIKGALLSISVAWQIPIIYSTNTYDSAHQLIMASKQNLKEIFMFHRPGYKPKSVKRRALFFLQGIPCVGPNTARALLTKFGTLEKIFKAPEKSLLKIDGLGKVKVKKIREFLEYKYD